MSGKKLQSPENPSKKKTTEKPKFKKKKKKSGCTRKFKKNK